MKIGPLEFETVDAVGLAVALAIAIAGTTFLIRGPIAESAGLGDVRNHCDRLARELTEVQTNRQQLARDIAASTQHLTSQGGGLPSLRQVEPYLAQVTTLASTHGLTIDSFIPSPAIDRADHLDVYVNFTGRGSFLGFQRLLRAIEQDLDYADVTHLGIAANQQPDGGPCRLEWSLRIRVSSSASPIGEATHALAS